MSTNINNNIENNSIKITTSEYKTNRKIVYSYEIQNLIPNKPNENEYLIALEIVNLYESQKGIDSYKIKLEKKRKRLNNLKLNVFRQELIKYFKHNKLDGYLQVDTFELKPRPFADSYNYDIHTIPEYEEQYSGSNDQFIKKLATQYGINASFVYWMYPK